MTQDTTRSQIKATLIDYGVTQVSGAMLDALMGPTEQGEVAVCNMALRSAVFAILRQYDVSEECFAAVASVTHASLSHPVSTNMQVAEAWQPIETAPRRQKVIAGYPNRLGNWRTVTACYHTQLPWSDYYDWREGDGEYAPEGWYEESETHDMILRLEAEPTHWMPLPAPPSTITASSTTEGDGE